MRIRNDSVKQEGQSLSSSILCSHQYLNGLDDDSEQWGIHLLHWAQSKH